MRFEFRNHMKKKVVRENSCQTTQKADIMPVTLRVSQLIEKEYYQ